MRAHTHTHGLVARLHGTEKKRYSTRDTERLQDTGGRQLHSKTPNRTCLPTVEGSPAETAGVSRDPRRGETPAAAAVGMAYWSEPHWKLPVPHPTACRLLTSGNTLG